VRASALILYGVINTLTYRLYLTLWLRLKWAEWDSCSRSHHHWTSAGFSWLRHVTDHWQTKWSVLYCVHGWETSTLTT